MLLARLICAFTEEKFHIHKSAPSVVATVLRVVISTQIDLPRVACVTTIHTCVDSIRGTAGGVIWGRRIYFCFKWSKPVTTIPAAVLISLPHLISSCSVLNLLLLLVPVEMVW